VKIRSLLTILAMFSVLLLGAGTAHAVYGVADDVPAQDLIIPIICGKDANNGVNTAIAIAEVTCGSLIDPPIVGWPNAVVQGHFGVNTVRSDELHTFDHYWTCHDVEDFNCKDIVADMNPTDQTAMEITLAGKVYYAGYLTLRNFTDGDERFVGWAYLNDLQKGIIDGMNALAMENGIGTMLEENGLNGPITVETFFPRYFILNSNSDTYNWWLFLFGRNQLSCGGVAPAPAAPGAVPGRLVTGIICNQEEVCPDFDFPVPYELNILNVADRLPGGLHSGYPKGGFARLQVLEAIDASLVRRTVNGTRDFTVTLCGYLANQFYSGWGWSYQRAIASNAIDSWGAIHPMHRDYCNVPEGMAHVLGNNCTETTIP